MTSLTRRRLLLTGPLAIAAAAGGASTALLWRMQEGRYDPHALPSVLVGKKLPEFDLPGQNGAGLTSADITAAGRPGIINFFASWCLPCVQEAPALAELGRKARLFGIAYKDQPAATSRFLDRYGDPYRRVGRDAAGTTGIDFGLYGVPETYLVDGSGVVRWRWAGGMSADTLRGELLPRLAGAGMRRLLVVLVLLMAAAPAARAVSDPGEMLPDPRLERRAEAVGEQLRCLVCQNESIEQSDADLAKDLRRIIRQRITAGDSDRQVVGWMVARYGDFVRLSPPFEPITLLLWGAPGIAIATGAFLVLLGRRRRDPPRPLSEAERRRLAELLK